MASDDNLFNDLYLDNIPDFGDDFEIELGNKNEPVTPGNVVKKTMKEATNISADRVSKIVKAGLPEATTNSLSNLESRYDTLTKAVNTNMAELKKELQNVGSIVDGIVPKEGILRDIFSKIYKSEEEKAKEEELSREERELEGVKAELLEGFGDIAKAQEIQNKVNNVLNDKRVQSTNAILKELGKDVGFLKEYNLAFNTKFQNKLLEVQIRSMYILNDIRNVIRETSKSDTEKLTAIVQNTGLPDVLKARQNFSMLKGEFMGRLRESLLDKLFNKDKNKRLNDNITNAVGDIFGNILNPLQMVQMPLEMIKSEMELNRELGLNVGDSIASRAVDYGDKKLGKLLIGKLAGNKYLQKLYTTITALDEDPTLVLNQAADKVGETTFLHRWLGNGLRYAGDVLNVNDSTRSANLGRLHLDDATQFDYRTKLTLQKVIPGYLRMIHGEVRSFRLGYQDLDTSKFERWFNYNTHSFTTKGEFINKLKNNVKTQGRTYTKAGNRDVSSKVFKISGLDKELNGRDLVKIRKWILWKVRTTGLSMTEIVRKYDANMLSEEIGISIDSANIFLRNMENVYNDPNKSEAITRTFNRIRHTTPGFSKLIENDVDNGMEDLYIEAGYLKRDEDGNLSVDDENLETNAYGEYIAKQDISKPKQQPTGMKANFNQAKKWFKGVFNIGKHKLTRSDIYQKTADLTNRLVNNIVIPNSKKLGGKYSDLKNKIVNNPSVVAGVLYGKVAYNKAVDAVLDSIGNELDEAEKSSIRKDLESAYGDVKKFAKNQAKEFLGEEYENLVGGADKLLEKANPKNAKGFFGRMANKFGLNKFKKDVMETDEMKAISAAAQDALDSETGRFMQNKLVEGREALANYKKRYEGKDARGIIKQFGEDIKADTDDTREKLKQYDEVNEAISILKKAAESGDEAFYAETKNMLKEKGLDLLGPVKRAITDGENTIKNRKTAGKNAERYIGQMRDPIEMFQAIFRLSSFGVRILPIKSMLKLSWSAIKMLNDLGKGIDRWIWNRPWNATIGRVGKWFGKDWNMKTHDVSKALSPVSFIKGIWNAGVGGYKSGGIGKTAVGAGYSLLNALDVVARGIGLPLTKRTQSEAFLNLGTSLGKTSSGMLDLITGILTGGLGGYGRATEVDGPNAKKPDGDVEGGDESETSNKKPFTLTGWVDRKYREAKLGVKRYSKELSKKMDAIDSAKAKPVLSDEEKKARQREAILVAGAEATILNSSPEVQQEVLANSDVESLQPLKQMPLFKRMKLKMKEWIMEKLKAKGKKALDFLKMIGGKALDIGKTLLGPFVGVAGALLGPLIGPIIKPFVGPLTKLLKPIGSIADGILKMTSFGLLGKGALSFGGLGKGIKNMLGLGEELTEELTDTEIPDMPDKPEPKNNKGKKGGRKGRKGKKFGRNAKSMKANAKKMNTPKVNAANAKQKGLMTKIKNALKSFLSTAKEKILKRLGPKAGGKIIMELTKKVGSRLVPFVGWGLLAYDCISVGMYLAEGSSFLSAISKAFIGIDLFSDSPDEVIRDENGDPVKPDDEVMDGKTEPEVIKKAIEEQKKLEANKKEVVTKADTYTPDKEPSVFNNALVHKTSTGTEATKSNSLDMSIFRSSLDINEKQLVVMMSNNQELKSINSSIKSLSENIGSIFKLGNKTNAYAPVPEDRKQVSKELSKKPFTIDIPSGSMNNSRKYNI